MNQDIRYFSQGDILEMDKPIRRNLINSLTGFKSLCLCGTCDYQGQTNLTLLSQVIHVGANPPLMGVLFRPNTVPRHTLANIEATRLFTLNHVREDIYQKAHQTSASYPEEVSEFDAVGLTPTYSDLLQKVPYVAESHVKIGLQLKERHQLISNMTIFIVGEIIEIMLPDQAIGEDGFIDLETTGSLTVSGLDSYHRTERIARLRYPKPDRPVEPI